MVFQSESYTLHNILLPIIDRFYYIVVIALNIGETDTGFSLIFNNTFDTKCYSCHLSRKLINCSPEDENQTDPSSIYMHGTAQEDIFLKVKWVETKY